jgi:hypothetical protein
MALCRAYSWIMWHRIHRRLGARPSGQPLQPAVGQRLRDQGAGRFQLKSMVSFSLPAKNLVSPSGGYSTTAPKLFITPGPGSPTMENLSIFTCPLGVGPPPRSALLIAVCSSAFTFLVGTSSGLFPLTPP